MATFFLLHRFGTLLAAHSNANTPNVSTSPYAPTQRLPIARSATGFSAGSGARDPHTGQRGRAVDPHLTADGKHSFGEFSAPNAEACR